MYARVCECNYFFLHLLSHLKITYSKSELFRNNNANEFPKLYSHFKSEAENSTPPQLKILELKRDP